MEKILTFIVNEDNEFLLLKTSAKDPQFKEFFWYVVTGSCENRDTSYIDTVKREVKEETNLDIEKTIYLNWIFKYISLGVKCTEYVYISFVKKSRITLNEENISYKWCDLEKFIDEIKWYGDKKVLKNVLEKTLKQGLYFNTPTVENIF